MTRFTTPASGSKDSSTSPTPTRATEVPTPGSMPARLAELRRLSASKPGTAQRETWEWIRELGAARADDELRELFALGTPPRVLDGPTDGILVTTTIQPAVDRILRLVTGLWMPWQGKRFDAAAARGDNRLVGSARWPSKLLWPLYGTREAPDGRTAFDFETAVEPGRVEPAVDVLKIDYAPVAENPRLLIRQIRDELVELVPDTYLGRILLRRGEDRYACIGYFALRQPAGAEGGEHG
jgi:hypothetical protein